MSRLHDLLRRLNNSDPALAADLKREVDALADRRAFGLNFERHVPEAVELPGRKIRRGDKVRVLPERGVIPTASNDRLWRAVSVNQGSEPATAVLEAVADDQTQIVPLDNLVVVAEFRDPIYPGLVSTGRVERGGDKPFHTVINAENFHALQTLLFTHRGTVDCIYIDPPYNTGAKDWKYNNDYVEGEDLYRHSKWLAFMERRLQLAKELLNSNDSVLIVTIDEKEYLRLGMLLEQVFPDGSVQMVTSAINATGAIRSNEFTRVNEFIFFVLFGKARILPETLEAGGELPWNLLQRREMASKRGSSKGGPEQFYPIYVDDVAGQIVRIGEPIPFGIPRETAPQLEGCTAIFPLKPDGTEMNWGLTGKSLQLLLDKGYVRVVRGSRSARQPFTIYYLTSGKVRALHEGEAEIIGRRADGSVIATYHAGQPVMPTSMWSKEAHNAQSHGTKLLSKLLPSRAFPFPKSLYAVEDALRFFVKDKSEAVVLDFFAGSGTTLHAVMRLNRQDGGSRRCISVTNNEVSADEQKELRKRGLRPGDTDWEQWGICDYVTKPRIEAAIAGRTPEGQPIKGDYKFRDEFPMEDGFEENAEFFTLTYESPLRVSSNREFAKIAPLLWMRAGSQGRRIDDVTAGWDVADTYGVIADLNQTEVFLKEVTSKEAVGLVYIVTDEDRLFESVVRELPEHVEPVRLYEAYLRNFEIETGRNSQ